MKEQRNFPNIDRLSIIIATVLLAYALTVFITFPTQTLNLQLPGFLLSIKIDFITVVSFIVAILAGAGADWLISDHPHVAAESRWQHWILPAFTALAIGIPLDSLRVSPSWWVVFGLGGLLLIGVLVSEYISVDPADLRHIVSVVSLTAVSLALLLVLLIAVRGAGLRLYLVIAAVVPTIALVTTKILHLRLGDGWHIPWVAGITLGFTQLATTLYYLPFKPLQYGLILLGIAYGLISLAGNIEEHQSARSLWVEPAIMFLVLTTLAILQF